MYGYGRGWYGYGRGWYGYGRGWWRGAPSVSAPAGYRYIGPCRCGWGPNAFYQDASGRIVHASELYRWGVPAVAPTSAQEDLKAELEDLKKEKEDLEKRIAELEKMTKENPS